MSLQPTSLALLVTGIVTVMYQLSFFTIAAYFKFDKVTDLAGGSNFVVVALITFFWLAVPDPSSRQILSTFVVTLWGLRLSIFLLYRVIIFEKDDRFDGTREDLCKFFGFWFFQMLWVWIVSLPITYCNSAGSDIERQFHATDAIGLILAILGLVLESWADQSKLSFKLRQKSHMESTAGGARQGWCTAGLWRFSRHPNYFGELCFWWGVFILCIRSFSGVNSIGYFTIVSPLFISYLLLGLSGMPILESNANKKFGSDPLYREYRRSTSILIPMPTAVYGSLPPLVKAVLLFEWPCYARNLTSSDEQRANINEV